MVRTLALLLLLVLVLAACPRESLEGHRCNDAHPCLEGFVCQEGRCQYPSGDGEGEGEGAGEGEGEGEGGGEGEGEGEGELSILTDVPGLDGYSVVYRAELPIRGARFNTTGAPWSFDDSAALRAPFSRVGWFLELEENSARSFVYVEVDAFTSSPAQIGFPTAGSGAFFQQALANGRVVSNHPGVTSGEALGGLAMEFWPSNYGPNNDNRSASPASADDARYDFGDGDGDGSNGHGSMQVHNVDEGRTLFAINDWGGNSAADPLEIGIGNRPTGEPDWTFSNSADAYQARRLVVVVNALPDRPPMPPTVTGVPANIEATVGAEASAGYRLIYELSIPDSAAFGAVPYTVDDTDLVPPGSFDRVAWYLELQRAGGPLEFVWVSTEAFTADAARLGVPTTASGAFFQHVLGRSDVVSNVLPEVQGATTLNIEFWPTNYAAGNSLPVAGASGTEFDAGDTPTAGGYGGMQIHDLGSGTTLFAYNHWGDGDTVASDLGIGNAPVGNVDWTFAENAGDYSVKRLQVLVRARP